MGRRSRKRGGADAGSAAAPDEEERGSSRAQRDAARERRARALERPPTRTRAPRPGTPAEGRPPAPWGSWPLAEGVGLLALVLLLAGFVVQGVRGFTMIVAALVLGSLVGLELSVREHFAGHRSHSALLGGVAAVLAMMALVYTTGYGTLPPYLVLPFGLLVFGPCFLLLRRAFRRRSGGVSFR